MHRARHSGLSKDQVLARLRTPLDARYGDRLERAVLFGSRARGDARPDFDFDVAVGLRDYTDLWNGYGRSARSPPISSRIPER